MQKIFIDCRKKTKKLPLNLKAERQLLCRKSIHLKNRSDFSIPILDFVSPFSIGIKFFNFFKFPSESSKKIQNIHPDSSFKST